MKSLILTSSALALMSAGIVFAAPDKGKTPPPPPPAPNTPATTSAASGGAPATDDFAFDEVPMPEKITRGGGGKEQTETAKRLAAVPVGKSWLEPIVVPDTITDEKERTNHFNEQAKKIQNRMTGAIRRHKKAGNENQSFSVLRVNDETRGYGVRVYRNEDEKPAEAPKA